MNHDAIVMAQMGGTKSRGSIQVAISAHKWQAACSRICGPVPGVSFKRLLIENAHRGLRAVNLDALLDKVLWRQVHRQ
eukprot:1157924-Pelagomonas_calceolata.AAC.8